MTLLGMTESGDAECHLSWVFYMLSVTNKPFMLSFVHHDTQHNHTQHNCIHHNDTQHNVIQHRNKNATISIMTLCWDLLRFVSWVSLCWVSFKLSVVYAECRLCRVSLSWVSVMLSVIIEPFMLSVIMPDVAVLNVVMLRVMVLHTRVHT